MSTTEFWNEEPDLLWTYHFLYEKKLETEKQKIDFVAWLQGYYITRAIATCFSKGKKYPKEPEFAKKVVQEKNSNKLIVANKIKESLNRNKKILETRGRDEGQKTQ